jgi:hypothetical protein
MSASGERRDPPLVRADHKGLTRGGQEAEGEPVRGGGLLQQSERAKGEDAIPVAFLLAYVRCLIRNNPSGDLHALSLAGARRMVPITDEQEQAFLKAIAHEAEQSHWPKGFF